MAFAFNIASSCMKYFQDQFAVCAQPPATPVEQTPPAAEPQEFSECSSPPRGLIGAQYGGFVVAMSVMAWGISQVPASLAAAPVAPAAGALALALPHMMAKGIQQSILDIQAEAGVGQDGHRRERKLEIINLESTKAEVAQLLESKQYLEAVNLLLGLGEKLTASSTDQLAENWRDYVALAENTLLEVFEAGVANGNTLEPQLHASSRRLAALIRSDEYSSFLAQFLIPSAVAFK